MNICENIHKVSVKCSCILLSPGQSNNSQGLSIIMQTITQSASEANKTNSISTIQYLIHFFAVCVCAWQWLTKE